MRLRRTRRSSPSPTCWRAQRAQPGKLTYTITSLGSVYHLLGKWIDMQAGTDMVPIPYRGASPAVNAGDGDLRLPADPLRSASRARDHVTETLRADAGRADCGRDIVRRRIHVVARPRHRARHAAPHRRSSECR